MNEPTSTTLWPECCVAILNYNGKKHLQTYLPSVLATDYPALRVVVIDNASTDDSVTFLNHTFPQVEIIQLKQNYGYAGGYNQGLKDIETEFWVLLNSDVETPPNWLKPLMEFFLMHPEVGAIQPKILDFTHKDKFEYAGAAGGYLDILGYPFCRGRLFDKLESDKKQYDTEARVFWASGACLAIRRSAFLQAGGFDASFFAHMEEIDLCWRLNLLQFEIWCLPDSQVFHLGGGTLAYGNSRKIYLNFRNSLLMLARNLSWPEWLPTILLRLMLDGIAGLQFLAKGNFYSTLAIIHAHFGFYKRLPIVLKTRRNYKQRAMKDLPGVFPKSIVSYVFLRKINRFSKLNWHS